MAHSFAMPLVYKSNTLGAGFQKARFKDGISKEGRSTNKTASVTFRNEESFLLVSTLLATATAVRIPYRYSPEAKPQGWPLREAYLSDLDRAYMASGEGEVETMQQEAIQQESEKHSIGVETLTTGQTVKVTYTPPDKGRVMVNF